MKRSNSFVTAGFDALPARIAILDDEGEIVYTNESWDAFGVEQGQSGNAGGIGRNYLAVCDGSDDPDATEAARGIRAVAAGECEAFTLEYPCHTPEGDHWFTMEATPYDHDGDEYVLVMHVDITERYRLEQRTQEQADRMESFAKLLSHDLRNPLSVGLARAEALELDDAVDLEETDGDRSALRSSLERMESIIDDALVLVTTDRVEETESIPLATAVETAWTNVRTGSASVSVSDDVAIRANASLASHLFENLFRNAVEHAGDDVAVEIGVLETESGADAAGDPSTGGERLERSSADWRTERSVLDGFYVEDDGPGIPVAARDQVFESGYSADGGSGLGLAIVREVADAHDWSITVTAGRDGGARFELRGVSMGAL
ncbi:sensor histidine kinase [Natrinema salaciae]|uniref:histidine kinase n=1 Tax=Natrinema salaciae TaxID=1186196 RepID=A0A1H9EDA4_9EURY|nr:PAS domain-containing sensor histidine kinase [Natrinema salaciae]SEQ23700.1 His Kinase A (phospho-acceptor) domain-containing protein [Natrinema salaciae]